MENSIKHEVIIVGAGPAGLALGYALQKSGVDYLILEQNEKVGSTWDQMPDHLHLITLWHSNCLIEEDLPLDAKNKAHPAKEFATYLKNFAIQHKLKIKTSEKVLEKEKVGKSFVVKTINSQYLSKIVIDCTGYFNYPFIPRLQISGNPPLMMHFKEYKNCVQFDDYKKILVVGKRLSAGQLLRELAATGRHELFISVRSEIKFSSIPLIHNFFLKHLGFIESLIKKLRIGIKTEVDVPMHYNAKNVLETKTKVKGDIIKIEDKDVHFTDGSIEKIDAILFATGFKPNAVKLKNDFESSEIEGLFYLGRGTQRTFTSRFIRGIRDDAPVLCQLILGRLASINRSQ